ncbi:MAG TPA: TlpA disulfide reductase family protein [Bacteroidales bacterium]|nr:TlpA disulfide reductase family protein [Bacteroidales bacterium]
MRIFKPVIPIILLSSIIILSGCGKKGGNSISIKGSLEGAPDKTIVLFEMFPDSASVIDSVNTDKSGAFNFRFRPREAGFYLLRLDGKNFITLAAEPGESIEVAGKADSLSHSYTVSGSQGSSLYRDYLVYTDNNQAKVDSLSSVFMASQSLPDFQEIRKNLDSAYYVIFNDQQEYVRKFISDNAGKLVSLLVINRRFGPNLVVSPGSDLKLFNFADSVLSAAYPDNSRVKDFHKSMDDFRSKLTAADQLSKKLLPGSPEPDLRLPDATGNTIRLSSLSGKPHLIYFWGSWNAPSRKMNLELVPVYNEFREKGFEIYAIALDTQKETWMNAYRLDKATWINVNDFKGLDSPAAKECGTGSIPTTILIGADGKVVARNMQAAELKTWLMTHLNKQ